MAIARPPQFGTRKTKRISNKAVGKYPGTGGNALPPEATPPRVNPHFTAAAVPPVPLHNPTSGEGAAPAPPPVPGTATNPVAPPETLAGKTARIGAGEDYGLAMPDVNRRLLAAAMQYGGVDRVTQAGLSDTGSDILYDQDVSRDPNSAMSVLDRSMISGSRGINEDLNTRGSYFSGAHLDQQNELNADIGRQRLAAKQQFDSAVATLLGELAKDRATREQGLRGATLADIEAAAGTVPVAESDTTPESNPQPGASRPTSGGGRTPEKTTKGITRKIKRKSRVPLVSRTESARRAPYGI